MTNPVALLAACLAIGLAAYVGGLLPEVQPSCGKVAVAAGMTADHRMVVDNHNAAVERMCGKR